MSFQSPADPCRGPACAYNNSLNTPTTSVRNLSTLQPPPYPLPGPSYMQTDIHIPMSPPPRNGTLPPSLRPLVLPSPPATPSFLPFPAPQLLNVYHIRQIDNIPTFRFSDLHNVNRGAIAQSYNVFESSGTPIYTPYSIAKMLNEEPLMPELGPEDFDETSNTESEIDNDSDTDMIDVNDIEMVPLCPATSRPRPSPKMTYGGEQPRPPPITIIDATLYRHDHMQSGRSCDMDTSPLPSSSSSAATLPHFPAIVHHHHQPIDRSEPEDPTISESYTPLFGLLREFPEYPQIFTPDYFIHTEDRGYRVGPYSPTTIEKSKSSSSSSSSSVSTTTTNVSPRTVVTPPSRPGGGGPENARKRKQQSIYRGWQCSLSSSAAGGLDRLGGGGEGRRKRESRFREDMDVCGPEGHFGSGGSSGYEGGDENEDILVIRQLCGY